jgi:hypothetical protein
LFPDVYIPANLDVDHRLMCMAALVYARRRRPRGSSAGAVAVSGSSAGAVAVSELSAGAVAVSGSSAGAVAVSGLSAAACWGVDLLEPDAAVELTVPPTLRLASRPGELHVVRSDLGASDVLRFGSLILTSPERTTLDVIRRSDRIDGVVLLDAMLRRRIVTLPALADAAVEWLGRRGGRRIGEALRLGEPLSESPMETRSRLVLVDAGLPRPVAQYVVRDADGRFVARLDLAYPAHRVGLEYEGDHHRERATFRRDIARLNALSALDWIIIRVTADDIYRNPDQLVRRVADILRRHAPRSA